MRNFKLVVISYGILTVLVMCLILFGNLLFEDHTINHVNLSKLDINCCIDVYQKGPHVYALLKIFNDTKYDVPLRKCLNLSYEDDIRGGVYQIKYNGVDVRYAAPLEGKTTGYYMLRSGSEYKKEIKLSEFEDFTSPGDYQIQYVFSQLKTPGENTGILNFKSDVESIKIEENNIPDLPSKPNNY